MALPKLPPAVTLVEVGPRDGLQNEPAILDTAAKVAFVEALADAGLPVVEVTAFVSPARVPQMADASAVAAGVRRRPGTRYTALVPNLRGLDLAQAAGLEEVAVFAATSDTFSRRNINQDVAASMAAYGHLVRAAVDRGIRVRGYLSTAFGCPFEGPVAPARVGEVAAQLAGLGVYEVSVSDTIGVAHPGQVEPVVAAVAARIGPERVALHFHDTRGTALANVVAGLACGVATFDASAGGLGGCPFAPGAAGNLATEDLVYALDGLGIHTGVSLDGVLAASRQVEPHVGHPLPSRCYRAAGAAPGTPGELHR
jgi:isopropylmalate/homocitrate/citramalate synthase